MKNSVWMSSNTVTTLQCWSLHGPIYILLSYMCCYLLKVKNVCSSYFVYKTKSKVNSFGLQINNIYATRCEMKIGVKF